MDDEEHYYPTPQDSINFYNQPFNEYWKNVKKLSGNRKFTKQEKLKYKEKFLKEREFVNNNTSKDINPNGKYVKQD